MSSSRWGPSNPSSSSSTFHPPRRVQPQDSGAEDSFLWLSTSFNTEANPLGAREDFPGELGGSNGGGGDSSVRTTFGGKPSRGGYYNMDKQQPSTSTSSFNNAGTAPQQPSTSSSNLNSRSNNNLTVAPTGPVDTSAFRSSWTSTDSDNSKASISPSDFEFLTPSFIAIDNNPSAGHGPQQGKRGEKNRNLEAPSSNRVTGDSHTLGRLQYRDRESSILPPASVRSGITASDHADPLPVRPLPEDYPSSYPPYSSSSTIPSSALSPTQPLNLTRKPSNQKPQQQQKPQKQQQQQQKSDREPLLSSASVQQPLPQSTIAGLQQRTQKQAQRYYHQPPPLPEENQRQAATAAAAAVHGRSGSSTSQESSNNPNLYHSSTRGHGHGSSSNTTPNGPTYPPSSFANPTKSSTSTPKDAPHAKNGSYSAASSGAGYVASGSVSPTTSVSASFGAPLSGGGGVGGGAYGGGRTRGNSGASENTVAKHPYASSTAYRLAVTDYNSNSNNDDGGGGGGGAGHELGYMSPGSQQQQQHPFASSYNPTPRPLKQQPSATSSLQPLRGSAATRERESSNGGYTSEGSEGVGMYSGVGRMGVGSPPRVNPSLPPGSRSTSNLGHGVSEVQRDRDDPWRSDGEHGGGGWGFRLKPLKENGSSSGGEGSGIGKEKKTTSKKEKRQSAATLLSLRIRNIYPVPSPSSSPPSRTRMSGADGDRYGFQDPQLLDDGENIDFAILRWFGILLALTLLAGVVPLLGTIYVVAGHAILRARVDGSTSPSASASNPFATSVYLQASIGSTAQAGAVGGAILAFPILLLIFIAVGPESLLDFKNKVIKWMKVAVSPSTWEGDASQNPEGEEKSTDQQQQQQQPQQTAAERRRSRRASSLWGPTAASTSFKEQSTAELTVNITINVFLAFLFLCLGAASAALGVTVLSPSTLLGIQTSGFLSPTTAALAGLVGGAVVFGGTVIIGGVLAWVIYEGGKPVPLAEQQLAVGSIAVRGVNVGLPRNSAAVTNTTTQSQTMRSGTSTFFGGAPTATNHSRDPSDGRWV
ncbi:hypothetical protein EST38_g3546 [Candolleomyces aberdarensis]|uniref:Uncharacterized protein n=1 Tax=Candolleomyces aberdarensis TaxID=2316362 RepID=A0A4Q2DQ35_9AGAR|nr:hypothetical protein EST38_g3546 [Candolleomyces aberdarensis]